MKAELVYLACPYTHKEHYMMVARHLLVNKVAARLMAAGHYVFSPISHTHPIAEAADGNLPRGWDFWEGYDRRILSCCNRIAVLRLPGWETSTGVQAEIKIGQEMGIPIDYLDYDLTPTIDDVVSYAKGMEIQVCPDTTFTVVGSDAPRNTTTVSSAYDGEGVCISPTDVCSLRYGILP